jgi:hypothetical protein
MYMIIDFLNGVATVLTINYAGMLGIIINSSG